MSDCNKPKRWLFVRQQPWIPVEVATRFDGVVVTLRTSRGRTNRSRSWFEQVREKGTSIATVDLMLPPGQWRPSLSETIKFASDVGAIAHCLDVEPTKATHTDWRGKHDELEQYATRSRDLCDARGLELWATGWAMPGQARTFPWLELLRPAHRAIVQCYEVHGRSGVGYVTKCVDEYRDHGARGIIIGRGAHELDKGDSDAWRTPAQINAHRASTLPGYDEAWWCPAGPMPDPVADAIVGP